ncbi:hypothetical protein [Corynebacterium sp.]|uniref:hypothetical protein n=1 Tax=Corynebacterium sp. TaxID=1720 RepID=UPI0026E04D97|nr:hypothetical protein [Corynebacterium sp.]MDO5512550.1 hypothetical protein [Corynebacterium sp.]
MVVAPCPLPRPPAGADVHSLPLDRVNQAILFSHLRTAELMESRGTFIPVVLVPDFLTRGWRVRWEYGVIGSLSAGMRAQFPEIERLHAAHLEPQVWARVCIDKERGLLDAAVELPAPELLIPRTNLSEGSRILPQGHRLPATLTGGNRQVLGQVSGLNVLVDEEVVAQLEYVPLLDGPLGVRIFVIDGESFVDLGLGDPREMPVLPEWEAPPPPAPAADPTAPWEVTMDAADLMEPNPTGPRTVVIPVVAEDG